MTLSKPKNNWAKALFILYDSIEGVSMAIILTRYDSTFYKFQSRLLEIEKEHPKLNIGRESIPYVSRIDGKHKVYTKYTLLSPRPYLINLYNLINERGLLGSVSETSKIVPIKKEATQLTI